MSLIRELFTSSVNSTLMSMNERFTHLQKNTRPVQTTLLTIRANNAAIQQASAKNRRLAMQMERRLSATAALRIKKKSIRQRLGVPLSGEQGNNLKDSSMMSERGRGRGKYWNIAKNPRFRGRGRSLRRSQSVQSLPGGNLQRSRSMQSLNNDTAPPRRPRSRSRSRSRSRARSRAPSVGPKETTARGRRAASLSRQERVRNPAFFTQQTFNSQRRKRSDSNNFKNWKARTIGIQKDQRKVTLKRGGNNGDNFQNRGRGSFRGRIGGGRGRGQGRGQPQLRLTRTIRATRNNPSETVPTKEELDKELEQYMANTKSQLDKDIDTYMREEDVDMLS